MKKTLLFLSTLLLIMSSVWSQNTPPSDASVITLTVEANANVRLDFMAVAENTPIWIETSEGNYTLKNIGTTWAGFSEYAVSGSVLKIHGDLKRLDCTGTDTNKYVKKVDAKNHKELISLRCTSNQTTHINVEGSTKLEHLSLYSNQISSLKVAGCTNLHTIFCENNQLDACALDALYEGLAVRQANNKGKLYVKDSDNTNPGIATSTTATAASKNWRVMDYSNNGVDLTGDGTGCSQNTPPADAKVITLTTEENATVNLDLKSKNANTPVWIETSAGNFTAISVGNNWTGFSDYKVNGNTLKVYGDISEFQCSGIGSDKNIKAIDATNHSLLEIILCYDNKISEIKIEGCSNLHSIYCDTNLLDACALNEIYANLPIRDSASKGKLYVKDDQGTNPGIATSNTSVAVAKNWIVADLNNSEGDIELTGDGTGCNNNTSDITRKNDIILYPNPTSANIIAEVSKDLLNTEIKIINTIGKVIKTQKLTNSKSIINTSDLKSGIYIIKTIKGSYKIIKK